MGRWHTTLFKDFSTGLLDETMELSSSEIDEGKKKQDIDLVDYFQSRQMDVIDIFELKEFAVFYRLEMQNETLDFPKSWGPFKGLGDDQQKVIFAESDEYSLIELLHIYYLDIEKIELKKNNEGKVLLILSRDAKDLPSVA